MRRSAIVIALLLLISIITFVPVSAVPAEVWVDDDGPDNGTDHFDTIQEGINAVDAGGTVHVAAGTYSLTTSISIFKNLNLLGAGEDVTIIDGNNFFTVITTAGMTRDFTIDGFTIQNGYHSLASGGMYNAASSPTISNCTFKDNKSTFGGAMGNNVSSSPAINDCTFLNNVAKSDGGAIWNNDHSSPEIIDCTFTNNMTYNPTGAAYDGGAIYNYNYSAPWIEDCTFTGNSAASTGGAIYNYYYCAPWIDSCTFTGNSAVGNGAAINNMDSSSPMITGCTFSDNVSSFNGGAINNLSSSPWIDYCVFTGNETVYGGGAMSNSSSSPIIINCTFSNNSANYAGGAIGNYTGSTPIMYNCTISNNTSPSGGGIYNSISTLIIINCIVWGNDLDDIAEYNSISMITYSDVGGGYAGIGNIDEDPLLYDAPNDDLRLITGSPCVDAGTTIVLVSDDIIGTQRPQGSAYDMGAYEGAVDVRNSWSGPVVMKPLVTVMLSKANAIWECIQQELPEELPEGVSAMLDEVQEQMSKAAVLSNPVYASGQLNIAFELLRDLDKLLSCGCYLV